MCIKVNLLRLGTFTIKGFSSISCVKQEHKHRVSRAKEQKYWKMTNERRNRFLSTAFVLLAIFILNEATNQTSFFDVEELIFPQLIEEEYYNVLIEYITHLFCLDGSYRFNHIYAERSLLTGLADILINRINKCMTAGVLISR